MLKLYCVIANHFFVILNHFCGQVERDPLCYFPGLHTKIRIDIKISDQRSETAVPLPCSIVPR
jgi:hypothetical protein